MSNDSNSDSDSGGDEGSSSTEETPEAITFGGRRVQNSKPNPDQDDSNNDSS